jgi:hypothetical protein
VIALQILANITPAQKYYLGGIEAFNRHLLFQ